MGLFDKIFPKAAQTKEMDGYFKTFSTYTPSFTTFDGGIYEMELTRSAVHSFATFCSKFKPEIAGTAYKSLEKVLQFQPNPFMDTTKFLYRIATILSVNTTAFIVPMLAENSETIVGFYPILPQQTEIVEYKGEPWLRYTFGNGKKTAIELARVGVMTQHQYKDDFFGDGNAALAPTMKLLDIQRQGMAEAISQSANIRFMAKIANVMRAEDLGAERDRFASENLSSNNKSGMLLFDGKYSDIKQIDSKPFVIDAEQMKLIQTNVYNYFNTNEAILQNKFSEEEFNAFYEGKLEPFALQLGLVLTNMTFTSREKATGNEIILTANRMQYASNSTKLAVSQTLFDRGILSTNQVMDIWNMAHVADGDKRYIRKEYAEMSKLDSPIELLEKETVKEKEPEIESEKVAEE